MCYTDLLLQKKKKISCELLLLLKKLTLFIDYTYQYQLNVIYRKENLAKKNFVVSIVTITKDSAAI